MPIEKLKSARTEHKYFLREKREKVSKILIVTNHSYMFYRFRLELIQELMKEHEVVLSMPFVGHEEDLMALGLRCINTKMDRRSINPKNDIKLFGFYWKLLKEEKPDIVITYSIKPNVYAGLACAMQGIPYYANVQGLGSAFERKGLSQFVTVMYKVAFMKVRTVFFENTVDAEDFHRIIGLPEEKQTVLNGAGISMDKYPYVEYPTNDTNRFLYLGRIMKEKGTDELFETSARLKAKGEHFIIDMVGFFEDEYRQKVQEMEEKGIVKFHGFKEDPRPYYQQADCVVMPSYHEGMSNVLLEAASMGRPIITSRIHGCMEAVKDGESGYLCEVKDEESLYKKMKQFISLPTEERKEMGVKGRQLMEEKFQKSKVVKETIAALNL